MIGWRWMVCGWAALALAGCGLFGGGDGRREEARGTTFVCGDRGEIVFTPRDTNPPTAWVRAGDLRWTLTLEQTPAGPRYVGPGVVFQRQGEGALVEVGGDALVCAAAG